MKNNKQFYADGCSIMIDGDDDVRLHYRNGYSRLRNPDDPESDPAEVHYMTCNEYDSHRSLMMTAACGLQSQLTTIRAAARSRNSL